MEIMFAIMFANVLWTCSIRISLTLCALTIEAIQIFLVENDSIGFSKYDYILFITLQAIKYVWIISSGYNTDFVYDEQNKIMLTIALSFY